jgi:hypothetical protein
MMAKGQNKAHQEALLQQQALMQRRNKAINDASPNSKSLNQTRNHPKMQ